MINIFGCDCIWKKEEKSSIFSILTDLHTKVVNLDAKIESVVTQLKIQEIKIMTALEALQAQNVALIANVAAIATVEESVVTAINGLTAIQTALIAKLNAAIAANDPAAIQAVADSMAAQNDTVVATTQKLADAVATIPPADTPVEPVV